MDYVFWLVGLFLLVVWICLRDPVSENLHSRLILHDVQSSGTGGLQLISPTQPDDNLELGVLVCDPRPRVVSSSISSPCSGSPLQPVFFSKDATKNKKRGRPKKKPKGRPKRKGSLSKEGAPSVSRELFGDGEHSGSPRGPPSRHGVADLRLSPSGA